MAWFGLEWEAWCDEEGPLWSGWVVLGTLRLLGIRLGSRGPIGPGKMRPGWLGLDMVRPLRCGMVRRAEEWIGAIWSGGFW